MSTNHTPKFAAIGDVEEYLSGAKVAWVQCRTKGHNMADHDVKLDEESNAYIVVLRCSRCYTKRDEVVNCDTGEVLNSSYHDHPEGYLLPKGTGRMGADARGLLRVARLRNALERKRDMTELAAKRTRKAR
jgi:hypothetical protein